MGGQILARHILQLLPLLSFSVALIMQLEELHMTSALALDVTEVSKTLQLWFFPFPHEDPMWDAFPFRSLQAAALGGVQVDTPQNLTRRLPCSKQRFAVCLGCKHKKHTSPVARIYSNGGLATVKGNFHGKMTLKQDLVLARALAGT